MIETKNFGACDLQIEPKPFENASFELNLNISENHVTFLLNLNISENHVTILLNLNISENHVTF
jgi:hypothetical protein